MIHQRKKPKIDVEAGFASPLGVVAMDCGDRVPVAMLSALVNMPVVFAASPVIW